MFMKTILASMCVCLMFNAYLWHSSAIELELPLTGRIPRFAEIIGTRLTQSLLKIEG